MRFYGAVACQCDRSFMDNKSRSAFILWIDWKAGDRLLPSLKGRQRSTMAESERPEGGREQSSIRVNLKRPEGEG